MDVNTDIVLSPLRPQDAANENDTESANLRSSPKGQNLAANWALLHVTSLNREKRDCEHSEEDREKCKVLETSPFENKICDRNEEGESGRRGEEARWKRLFYDLSRERITAPERQMKAAAEEAAERERALKAYIRLLERDLEEARDEKDTETVNQKRRRPKLDVTSENANESKLSPSISGTNVSTNEETLRLKARVQELERSNKGQLKVIEIYRMLTGTTISFVDQSCTVFESQKTNASENADVAASHGVGPFDCTVVNYEERIASKFRLTLLKPTGGSSPKKKSTQTIAAMAMSLCDVRFDPIANAENLPDFLQRPIDFEQSQGPAFMQNILRAFFRDD